MMEFEKAQVWRELNNDQGNYYTQVDENEREEFRSWIKGLLKNEKVTVTFAKATGEIRIMECTLSEEYGAKYVVHENKESTKKPNPEVCVVWDCNQNAWRSFRYDRIKQIEGKIG